MEAGVRFTSAGMIWNFTCRPSIHEGQPLLLSYVSLAFSSSASKSTQGTPLFSVALTIHPGGGVFWWMPTEAKILCKSINACIECFCHMQHDSTSEILWLLLTKRKLCQEVNAAWTTWASSPAKQDKVLASQALQGPAFSYPGTQERGFWLSKGPSCCRDVSTTISLDHTADYTRLISTCCGKSTCSWMRGSPATQKQECLP